MPAWNRIFIPKSKLLDLYIKKKMSILQIARLMNCSTGPVHRSLKDYGIPRRKPSQACEKVPVTKIQLKKWYFKKNLSVEQISKQLGYTHSAIVYKFKKYGLKSRGNLGLRKPLNITKNGIKYHYNRGLSLEKISNIFHCSESGLERRFKQYNIKSRGIGNRACKYKKFDFSGNPLEKAYMIGFRIGDLNVHKVVNTIQIRCSTTIRHQIKLTNDLFSPYTTVRISKQKRGDWDIVAYVNRSFDFLISKHKNIPEWIKKKEETFLSFFAGYIDAEGYFCILKPKNPKWTSRASFGIASQDKFIIHALCQRIKRFGIDTLGPYLQVPAGYISRNGTKNNKDMWCFEISKKEDLWRFIHVIEPYIKHAKKIERINEIKENIILRNSIPYCKPINLNLKDYDFTYP